jgi:hypothetical protein
MKKKYSQDELEKYFKNLNYNMLDCKLTAKKCYENPNEEHKQLKVLSHKALSSGRDYMLNKDYDKANNQFAFAYQMRCVADFTWKNILGKDGDTGHAKYLEISRDFSKLALKKIIPEDEKKKILEKIKQIKD